jgi:hypothetical protein
MMSSTSLTDEIAFYDEHRSQLEADYFGRWVLIRDRQLVNVFNDFDEAAQAAVRGFGRGPYLIRQVGAPSQPAPTSLLHRPAHALGAMRI